MFSIKVVDPDQLDFEAYCRLQKDAYADLLENNKASDDFMTPEFYRWKYAPPAGEAKIAVIYDKGRLVAANAMFPLLIRFQDRTIRGWQSCDTATHPLARGKGYFVKCLQALTGEIQEGDLFFGFPNRNSMRGFQKIGWIEIRNLPIWIKPYIMPGGIRPNPKIIEPQTFDQRQDTLNQLITDARYALLDRSADYMNWRYMNHPQCSYRILAYTHAGEWQGVAVFRLAQVRGKKWAMVMELWGLGTSIERELLKEISRRIRAQNFNRVVMLNTGLGRFNGIKAGFMPLPSRWAPKRNVLMGAANKGAAVALLTAPWCLRIGDWDVY